MHMFFVGRYSALYIAIFASVVTLVMALTLSLDWLALTVLFLALTALGFYDL